MAQSTPSRPLDLTLSPLFGDPPDAATSNIWRVVNTYLISPSEDAGAAAEELASHLTVSNLALAEDDPFNPYRWVELIFAICFHITEQVPWDHKWQHRLVSLVAALKMQPDPPVEVGDALMSTFSLPQENFSWKDLPTRVVGNLCDIKGPFERHQPRQYFRPEIKDRALHADALASVNRFLALVVADADDNLWRELLVRGVKILRDALEVSRRVYSLEDNLPAAAVWILTAGRTIYAQRGLDMRTRNDVWEEQGEDYYGPDGINDDRWQGVWSLSCWLYCINSQSLYGTFIKNLGSIRVAQVQLGFYG
ncbi:uncharacterized protein BCR38DRAFT_447829 [Pseudomassariella vexata]|uniref:Uncharacterized protein n=1 Tax=Pseudomassariella vexata TaxID=1141098 RepID=A0A1Y2DFJ1_9PEZI|nr:uncharacterized protein BCR38DRAFT_447829 [Pseudomassariella vexata]ORY58042.1 hypothetical protein BCR38DRAFT_447829 [Pseudomassariella vexata]